MPKYDLASVAIVYVIPTAKAIITRFVTIRFRVSMPERKATMYDTAMIITVATAIGRRTFFVPNMTGVTGIMAPIK